MPSYLAVPPALRYCTIPPCPYPVVNTPKDGIRPASLVVPSCAQLHTTGTGDWCPCQCLPFPSPPGLPGHLHYPTHGRPRCQAHLLRAAWQGRQRLPRFTTVLSSWEKRSRLVKRGSGFPGEKHSAQPPPVTAPGALGVRLRQCCHLYTVLWALVLTTQRGVATRELRQGDMELSVRHPLFYSHPPPPPSC